MMFTGSPCDVSDIMECPSDIIEMKGVKMMWEEVERQMMGGWGEGGRMREVGMQTPSMHCFTSRPVPKLKYPCTDLDLSSTG